MSRVIVRASVALSLLVLLIVVPAASVAASAPVTAASAPVFDPNDFVAGVDNPWFPLKPGTTLVYRGTKDGKHATDISQVTHRTKVIAGVRCVVILDTLVLDGRVHERTIDWYAQDKRGRVWYLGERTAEFGPRGNVVSREGSWKTGVNGAKPGIFMPAHPRVGQTFQQEYYPGHAEDHFRIVDTSANVSVPYGTFDHALATREWTPLEPSVRDAKFYVRGLGMVKEATLKGPTEILKLVQVIRD